MGWSWPIDHRRRDPFHARDRQESLPEVATVMSLLPECAAAPPEATVFQVSESQAAGA
jgi:hypothetical protein